MLLAICAPALYVQMIVDYVIPFSKVTHTATDDAHNQKSIQMLSSDPLPRIGIEVWE